MYCTLSYLIQPRNGTIGTINEWRWETIHRGRFVITQRWEDRCTRKHIRHLFDGLLDDLKVLFARLIPDVVRGQITSPEYVVDVLKQFSCFKWENENTGWLHSQDGFPRCASAYCLRLFWGCHTFCSHPT